MGVFFQELKLQHCDNYRGAAHNRSCNCIILMVDWYVPYIKTLFSKEKKRKRSDPKEDICNFVTYSENASRWAKMRPAGGTFAYTRGCGRLTSRVPPSSPALTSTALKNVYNKSKPKGPTGIVANCMFLVEACISAAIKCINRWLLQISRGTLGENV